MNLDLQKDDDGNLFTYIEFDTETAGLEAKKKYDSDPNVIDTLFYPEDGKWSLGVKFLIH